MAVGEEEKGATLVERQKEGDGLPRGMAWGAQSTAAARISKLREKDPESNSDFGRYMAEKRRKLTVQYNQDSSNKLLSVATAAVAALHSKEGQIVVAETSTKSRLFSGISIWVDGFTIPSHQELRHLMLQYGGVFENYFRRDLVTHVICSTLTDTKIKNPRSLSRGLPIVKPEWIVDSISAGRVLSWAPYQLERIALEHPNQRTLQSTYANPKLVHNPLPLDWRDSSPNAIDGEGARLAIENMQPTEKPGPTSSQAEKLEKHEEQTAEDHAEEAALLQPIVEEVTAAVTREKNRNIGTGHSDANTTHSTLGDKNFVQNYFKASRLHFIGTWRNRYQSRYGSASRSDGQEHQSFRANPGGDPAIIHIDMDCFFVAVVVRNRPELNGKPVAVCHSDSARGTGEISSANYPARAFGVRAGMFVRDAKGKCPDLEIVPYNFEAYEQVADKVYDILHHHCGRVQAVSCDEAFLDVTGQGDPCDIASMIRSQIFEATRCSASAGVSGNMLLARLATRKAKPNGQYFIAPSQVEDFLAELAVEDLPGVGWTLKEKLHSHNLRKCPDLRRVSKEFLQREFGAKTGDMLWSYARGIDVREVQPAQERKSIGAEVNWGVRFLVPEDAQRFLVTLSTEVATRLQTAAAKGRTITLKVKKRKEGAGEPHKYMGCGVCDNFSRSETVAYATDSQEVLLRVAKQLFNSFAFDVREVRGVGLQVTKLEAVGSGQSLKDAQGQQRALKSWLAPETTKVMLNEGISVDQKPAHDTRSPEVEPAEAAPVAFEAPPAESPQNQNKMQAELPSKSTSGDSKKQTTIGLKRILKVVKKPASVAATKLPALSELDPAVLASLPPEILAEIQEVYGELPVPPVVEERPAVSVETPKNGGSKEALRACETRRERGEPSRPSTSSVNPEIVALPPASQLDPSVMAALPLSLRRELEREYNLQQPMKKPNKKQPVPKFKPEKVSPQVPSESDGGNSTSLEDLWHGSPPKWVKLFKSYKDPAFSNLGVLAERMACEHGPFSTILLVLLPQLSNVDSVNESVLHTCVEVVKQYAQSMIAHDLEEVCMILRVLRRAAVKSQLWRIVEELTVPFVQGLVGECYGGHLKI